MKMLIGSSAAARHFPDFPRTPKDVDYICADKVKGEDNHFIQAHTAIFDKYPVDVAPPEVLYTLKVSHAFWDIHWSKTLFDIRFFQQKKVKLDEEIYKLLYDEWTIIHGKKRAMLVKQNEDFFKDNVNRKYVHDDLHRAIAYYGVPMFEKIKEDKNLALTSKKMFFELSYEDQLKCCREEIFVTALERFMIPADFKMSTTEAYHKSFKKLVTSMSKGWWPKFLVENWIDLCKKTDYPFVQKFYDALSENKLRLVHS
jgi:hypothetical protein